MYSENYNEKCSDSCANLFFVSPEQFGFLRYEDLHGHQRYIPYPTLPYLTVPYIPYILYLKHNHTTLPTTHTLPIHNFTHRPTLPHHIPYPTLHIPYFI